MCFSVIAEVSECPQASSCGAGRFVFKRHGLIDRAFPPWTWAVLAERPTFFAAISKDAPIVLRTPNHHAFGGELSACSKSALQKTQLYFVRRSAIYCDATSASFARPSQPSLGVSSLDLGRSHAGRPLFLGTAMRTWPRFWAFGPDYGGRGGYSAASGRLRSSGSSKASRATTVSILACSRWKPDVVSSVSSLRYRPRLNSICSASTPADGRP